MQMENEAARRKLGCPTLLPFLDPFGVFTIQWVHLDPMLPGTFIVSSTLLVFFTNKIHPSKKKRKKNNKNNLFLQSLFYHVRRVQYFTASWLDVSFNYPLSFEKWWCFLTSANNCVRQILPSFYCWVVSPPPPHYLAPESWGFH